MSKRGHGKINFMNLIDSTGNIQLFNKFNNFSEEEYGEIKKLDIGDIVGVEERFSLQKAEKFQLGQKNYPSYKITTNSSRKISWT